VKLYAIHDRLLDHWRTPFVAPNDKEVMTGLANVVNNIKQESDIAQTPHHFECWSLAEIDDNGNVIPKREFIADCSSLIRGNLRKEGTRERDQGQGATDRGGGAPEAPRGPPRAATGDPARQTSREDYEAASGRA